MATKSTRKKLSGRALKNFSLVRVHTAIAAVEERLERAPKTEAAKKLAEDLKNAKIMIGCGSSMERDLSA